MNPLDLVTPGNHPDDKRILTSMRAFTEAELLGRAAKIMERIAEAGLQRTTGVVSLGNGPDFYAGLVGSWMAGAVPVLLDPMVKREMASAVEATSARFVISESLSFELPEGVLHLVPDGRDAAPPEPVDFPPGSPLLHLFTSGSSGAPTLVPKTFGQIEVEVDFISRLFDRPRRVATLVPWCHIWGLLSSFFVPLRGGGTCDLVAGVSARTILERARDGHLDMVAAVPAYYQAMTRLLDAGVVGDLKGVCRFASSSAPLTASVRRSFTELSGCRLTDIYGSTETGGIAYRHKDGPWMVEPHVQIRIDEDGALFVKSASVSFETEDGFFPIGDRVRPEESGFSIMGRKDDIVKIGGRRISLGEIRDALEASPAVLKAAVVAVETRGALRLMACVEPSTKGELDVSSLKQLVRERLSDHKVPGVIRIVDEMPMTSSGKVSTEAVKTLLLEKA